MTLSTVRRSDRVVMLVTIAALLAAVVFGLVQRWQFVGSLHDLGHQGLTGTTVVGVENWERDGFWNDSGSLVEIPASIEFKGIQDRSLYLSYPPGAQIEIFLLKKIFRSADTTTLAQLFGIANQIAIAIICYLIATSFPFRVGNAERRVFATISAVLYLLLPIPYYWHSTVFFADQAVILPFALAIYLEALIRIRPRAGHFWTQSALLGAVAYIDWIIIPFAIVLFALRLISPLQSGLLSRRGQVVQIFLGPAIALTVHLAIVLYLHKAGALLERFVFRTGISNSGSSYVKSFFQQFFVDYLGLAATILIGLTAIFFAARLVFNRRDQVAAIALLGIATCLLQVSLLRNHSVNHAFSALKFILPLSYATFGLLPLAVLEFIGGRELVANQERGAGGLGLGKYLPGPRSAALLMGLFAAGYLLAERTGWQDLFPPRVLTNGEMGRWLGANAGYNDVFVSTEIDIQKYPPQVMALSRKYVWKFDAAPAVQAFVTSLPAGAVVHLIRKAGQQGCAESTIGDNIAMVGDYSVILVRVPPADLASCMFPPG